MTETTTARLIVDERHRYRGMWDREREAVCRVRIYDAPAAPPVIVCTELDENRSTSITNVAEYVAAEVLAKYLPHRLEEHEPCIWIEHYPRPTGPRAITSGRPSFDHVAFATWRPLIVWLAGVRRVRLGDPTWRHLTPAEVIALVGDPAILEE